jgi:hypothetical protein
MAGHEEELTREDVRRITDMVMDPIFGERAQSLDDIGDIVERVEAEQAREAERDAELDKERQAERRRQEFHRLADRNGETS